MSQRDAEVWFDQLSLPRCLCPFMGRPQVAMEELRNAGMPSDEIASYIMDTSSVCHATQFTPVNLTWAMGFSWSSFVAQSTMVHSCQAAGFPRECFLTEGHRLPPPLVATVCGALAVNTDDVTHFQRGSKSEIRSLEVPPLALLDQAWADQGIRGQNKKSMDLCRNGTALGVDLVDGVSLAPNLQGFADTLLGGVDLLRHRRASPSEVNSLSGKLQWYDLLNRCLLSALNDVYPFVRREDPDTVIDLPPSVLDEIALNISLFPYWSVDLTRGWLDKLPVSDASESFGFGLCVAEMKASLVRELGSLPYDADVYVRCEPEAGAPPERPRIGTAFRLPFALSHFKPMLSTRAKWKAHSGGLEAAAVAQSMRLLSRNPALHSHRGVFLVDARAVMGALRKGRTSAATLQHPLRMVSALCLACDWTWRYHYVPSESNAADWPSRGLCYRRERARQRRRSEQQCNGRVRKYSKLERWLTRQENTASRLKKLYPQLFSAPSATSPSSSASRS
jgi:hypothetical protein